LFFSKADTIHTPYQKYCSLKSAIWHKVGNFLIDSDWQFEEERY